MYLHSCLYFGQIWKEKEKGEREGERETEKKGETKRGRMKFNSASCVVDHIRHGNELRSGFLYPSK